MTNALVRYESLDELQRLAKLMRASGYFDTSPNEPQAVAQLVTKILAGQEMGYGPYASINGIHVIKGKPVVSANLMAAAVRSHPRYDYRVRKMSDTEVVIEFYDNGQSVGLSTFTLEDAKLAEVGGRDNWKKFPRNMLFARAISNGVRWYCPDVFSGNAVYVEGELDDSYTVVETEQLPPVTEPTDNGTAPAPVPLAQPFADDPFGAEPEYERERATGTEADVREAVAAILEAGFTPDNTRTAYEWAAAQPKWAHKKNLDNAWKKYFAQHPRPTNPQDAGEWINGWVEYVVQHEAGNPVDVDA